MGLRLLGVWSLVNEVPMRTVGSQAPAARTAESHSPELSRTPKIWVTEPLQTCDESSSLLSGTASALADLIFSVCKARHRLCVVKEQRTETACCLSPLGWGAWGKVSSVSKEGELRYPYL